MDKVMCCQAGMDIVGGGGGPPPRWLDDDDEIRRASFGQLANPLNKKMIFGPHRIDLCVQHIPLINLMGSMTFFERKLFSRFWTPFGPAGKKFCGFGCKIHPLP